MELKENYEIRKLKKQDLVEECLLYKTKLEEMLPYEKFVKTLKEFIEGKIHDTVRKTISSEYLECSCRICSAI